MSNRKLEAEIESKALLVPRVTPDDIEAAIVSEHYFTGYDGAIGAAVNSENKLVIGALPLEWLTFCVLVLRNGFTVTGESACVSPENFDAEIGRKVARDNAIQKMWPLMGYSLKQHLYEMAHVGTVQTDPIQ